MNPNKTSHEAGMRLDIQALRAIAISTVVIFHIWAFALPGGYVGVDIFFVISGYLITGQLWREVAKSGKIAFANFWARRARRLLPASLLVILATTVACVLWVPSTLYLKFAQDATGAAFYVQNWVLAARATDYLANDGTESAFQHFWSLSVEEQYYVFWPVLMGIALAVGRFVIRRKLAGVKAMVLVLLGLLTASSLVYSIWATTNTRELAYFSTFTRAWEFAGGALLSVLARPDRAKAQNRNPLWFYAGVALITYSLVSFNQFTPFPGFWALIPVLGAMLMLFGGESQKRLMPRAVFRFAPIKFLGDISYSLYLWHWPIIIVAPWLLKRPLVSADGFAILALAILLAWVSKRFVEDPIRFGRLSKMRQPVSW
jgi:peptidoglycan/LPS O-acetylase OafA/YrhL